MSRTWEAVLEHGEGRHTRHYRIVCSTCRTVGDSGAQSFGASTAEQVIPKKFRAMGWEVGKKPSQGMCPICVDVMKFERNQKEQTMKTQTVKTQTPERHTVVTGIESVRTVPTLQVVESTLVVKSDPPRAEPPREMSRDDRRIIFAKISEVYVNEEVGYADGWTDHKIAVDLGVPHAWVAKTRDDMFGPAGDNKQIKELIAEFEKLDGKIKAVDTEIDQLDDKFKVLVAEQAQLRVKMDAIRKQVGLPH